MLVLMCLPAVFASVRVAATKAPERSLQSKGHLTPGIPSRLSSCVFPGCRRNWTSGVLDPTFGLPSVRDVCNLFSRFFFFVCLRVCVKMGNPKKLQFYDLFRVTTQNRYRAFRAWCFRVLK